ncbi:MAG: hypothetical protein JNM56_40270 [Planctomycetia bacterium]|nr:hypothetical protein [Planctomycetia bacterium]
MTESFPNRLQSLPEAGQINGLLDELLPINGTAPPVQPAAALGSWRVVQFFLRMNWKNAPIAAPAPVKAESAVPPGTLSLKRFLTAINWRNRPRQTAATETVVPNLQTLERVLSEFVWD